MMTELSLLETMANLPEPSDREAPDCEADSEGLAEFETALARLSDTDLVSFAPEYLDPQKYDTDTMWIVAVELRHRLMKTLGLVGEVNEYPR